MNRVTLIAGTVSAALALAACANTNPGEMPTALATASSTAQPAGPAELPAKPIERHEASAQCWMKYDKAAGGLDAKAKLVDKCIDEKLKGEKPK